MMTQNTDKKREQIQMFCMDDLVPKDHLLRLIDKAIDWSFIYDLVEEKYCPDNGRPSIDPVVRSLIFPHSERIIQGDSKILTCSSRYLPRYLRTVTNGIL